MNPHLRSGVLFLVLVGVCAVVLMLRHEAAVPGDSTTQFDILLGVLGAAAVAVVVTYVLALKRRGAAAARQTDADEAEAPAPARGLSIERILGPRIGRTVGFILFGAIGLVVLFLVGLLGYLLYLAVLA